jgi:hypothetical protein
MPSLAWTIANSLVIASTAPCREDAFKYPPAKVDTYSNLGSRVCAIVRKPAALIVSHSQAIWGVAAPMTATTLAVLMILPPIWSPLAGSAGLDRIAWIAYLHPHQTPFRLICIVKSLRVLRDLEANTSSRSDANDRDAPNLLFRGDGIVIVRMHNT